MNEPNYVQWIAWIAGSIQTALYLDFFYYFGLSKAAGMKHVILPGGSD
jgi:ER lumen protein retaining receptor